ncbi:GNAT family N-acetyltransferase [Neobacillus driksii]|uniref:GNAT family N-acetyltransferase n=1 Tax=Neobacillus driksii TaxID=3035913 RepID=UPI0027D89CE2|nr:GNAT family N-acetyltransferase [Neobacillus niacini]
MRTVPIDFDFYCSIEENWTVKAIYQNDMPIGFTMYGYSDELAGYEICRIMIDYKFQGNGFGKKALLLVIKEMVNQFNLFFWSFALLSLIMSNQFCFVTSFNVIMSFPSNQILISINKFSVWRI